jgi:hypothetical protein
MTKPRKTKIEEDNEHSVLGVDMGSGRWFVLDRAGGPPFRLVAGPYQTEAAAERWIDGYEPPAGIETTAMVRCEGTWQDAVAHAEDALAKWSQYRRSHLRIV